MANLDLFLQKHAPATMNLMGNIPFKKWVDQPKLIDLETQYGLGSAGLPSIARHTAGRSNLSDTFASALAFDKNNPGRVSQFFGDVGAFSLGALNEVPGVYRSITGDTPISETWEDLKANALGTFKTDYGKTSEDIYKDVYAGEYTDLFDNQKGTIAFDPNKINKTGMLDWGWAGPGPYLLNQGIGAGLGFLRSKFQKGQSRKRVEDQRKQIQEAQVQREANQVRQNIQRYGSGDRPNTEINRPGGGRGQSPTGGDVSGTPFARGGIVNLLYGGFI